MNDMENQPPFNDDGPRSTSGKKRPERRGPRKVTAKYLENSALYYLGRFATSAANLRRVLMTKVGRSVKAHDTDAREGADMVEDLIKRFLHSGLLNDLDYAVGRVNSLHRQGSSQRSIRAKLAQKGVAPQVIDQALDTLTDETPYPELAAAVTFARKKRLGPYRRPDTDDRDEEEVRKRREKEMAAMARAGFGYEMVRKVIEAENIESLEEELRSPPE